MNSKSNSRILKAVCLCALLQIICYFRHIDNETDFIHRDTHYKKCLKIDSSQLSSNLSNNFLHQYDGNAEITSLTIKPIMHTFVEHNEDYVDKELLDYWMKSWIDAGWEIRILTPKDAVNYTYYRAFDAELRKNKICCLPRQTYLRHLAMSTVKEGGFYSEAYAFPLRSDLHVKKGQNVSIPNQGNFTSWDGIQGSLMSGSHNEWNRMTQLLMEKIKKNAVLSFIEISDESCDAYNHENLVADPSSLLSGGQFRNNMCNEFQNFLVLRFHPYETERVGIDKKDRFTIISSWFEIYNARCVSEHPAMLTFFEQLDNDEIKSNEQVEGWKKNWLEAGFEPVVLSMEDAKHFVN